MKSAFTKIALLLIVIAVPMFVWGTMSERQEIRNFAQDAGTTPTATPTLGPTATPSATPTGIPDVPPTCTGLSVIPASGNKPLTVSFACAGNDTDNDVTAAEFDFGEGDKLLVEKNIGQFGSITATHVYKNTGTYNVTCRVRDNIQKFSTIPTHCKKVVTVTTQAQTPTRTTTPDITIYTGFNATPTAVLLPTATLTPTPAPQPVAAPADYSKWWQIGQIVGVSIVTIIIGLILRRILGGSD